MFRKEFGGNSSRKPHGSFDKSSRRSSGGPARSGSYSSSPSRSASPSRTGSFGAPSRSGSFSPSPSRNSGGSFGRSGSAPARSGSSFSRAPRTGGFSGGFGGGRTGGFRGGAPSRFSRGGNGGGGRGRNFKGSNIPVSKFINKAVITEEIEHFIPEHAFVDFSVEAKLKENIIKKGYTTPTPIQDRAIPHVLKGIDVVGIANTGTGKTAAFLIPLIDKVMKNPKEKIIIAVPTRELAQQIEKELQGFVWGLPIFSVCTVGGSPIGKQIASLKRLHSFVIGTPGRIKDLIERRVLDLSNSKTVVLDEADRMLDMGFIGDMKFMMSKMPKDRQTLFFSATMSREIEVLIKDFLKEPVTISVKTGDTAKSVDQDIVRVAQGKSKMDTLHDLLSKDDMTKVLIFGKTKHGVERLSKDLIARGFKADSIHGDKNQSKRQRALGMFKDDHVKILVATDVAARGIDVTGISHVINYDVPATYEDYVHRIGRTGRGGKKGKALTFIE